ncbi:MAG TPA: YbjN domain-containing protein [Parachlamydiaceae bacterium]|nr:YbjN domain-containing protein [Parachlamydiaceae bacterium]
MITLDLQKIRTYLKSQGIEAELQTETNQLCILLKSGEREYPLFIRIYEGGELLQLLAFLPCNTKTETLPETARMLHLLNKEIDTPGFGMDEDSEVVFYRCMIPVKDKQIDENILNSYMNATQVVCQSFAPVIAAVAYGAVTFDEVMKKSKEQSHESLTQSQLRKE